MRIAIFSLSQLKQLHQGVQNVHSAVELFVKYANKDEPVAKYDMIMDWATNHKTAIVYDGGFAYKMKELETALLSSPYPYALFHEDEETLYGILTSISMIIPAKIYETADFIRNGGIIQPSASGKVFYKEHVITPWDLNFIQLLLTYKLAN
jgi:hypothetical protein